MSASPTTALTPERRRTLHAAVARILPGTDGPGAADTAAAVAVEVAILHRCMRELRAEIEQMLDRLQTQADERCGAEFAACAPADQDHLLRAIERAPDPWTRFLFRCLVTFSLEGLLGDPSHGGNRNFRGWESIGLRAADARSGLCRDLRQR
jgi:hypothetical protein